MPNITKYKTCAECEERHKAREIALREAEREAEREAQRQREAQEQTNNGEPCPIPPEQSNTQPPSTAPTV